MRIKLTFVIFICFLIRQFSFADAEENVILITADTLRADHLSCYGYTLLTSPNIDNFSRESFLFSSARTPIPTTSPAHASIMTSLYPHNHKVLVNLAPMNKEIKTLAEILQENGYKTAAIVSAWPLRSGATGLEKGFDYYNDAFTDSYRAIQAEQLADETTNKAINWLSRNKNKKFFLWIHYFDPHYPYREHNKLSNLPVELKKKSDKKRMRKIEKIIYKYDREIAFMDFHIGRLFSALQEWNLNCKTIVILTADHGESLGEHNYTGHGKYLYEPSLHVPLIIRHPTINAQQKIINDNVSLLDIMPTVLDFLNISSNLTLSGKSLVPSINGKNNLANRIFYFMAFKTDVSNIPILGKLRRHRFKKSFPEKIAMLNGKIKFIFDAKKNKKEMYAMTTNQKEETNLAEKNYELARMLKSELIVWYNTTKSSGLIKNHYLLLKEEDIKKLKSLGYIN
jgi:arylsulfatase A-like enzyme